MKRLIISTALPWLATAGLAQTLTWSVPPRGVAISADAAENVYTVDWDYNLGGDITLTKTSPWGVTLFAARYDNTSPTRMEAATWVEADSAGGALVSGTVLSGYTNPVPVNALLMRFAADGSLRWRTVIGADFDGGSTFRVLRDDSDNAYLLGIGPTPSGVRTRIHKVDPDGAAQLFWHDELGLGAPTHFKWGRDGNLVVAMRARTGVVGGAVLVGIDGRTLRAASAVPALGTVDAAADAEGNLYVASVDPATNLGRLARVAAKPGGDWQRSDSAALARVEAAADGAVIAGGMPSAGTTGVAFVKYDADGALRWENRDADGPANAFLSHGQMKLDGDGNVYLAASDLFQMSVTRGNADGSAGWAVQAPSGAGVALAFGAQSNAVYLVGGQTARIDQGGSPPPPAPDVAVTLADAPDPVPRDGELVLTTTVRNLGTGLASAVTLRHEFSGAVRGVSVTTTQGACSSLVQLTCSLGAIPPGQSVTVVQTVRPQRSGSLITTATARSSGGDQIPGNDTASVSTRVRKR